MILNEECRFCHTLLNNKANYNDKLGHTTYNCPICGYYTISTQYPLDNIYSDTSDIKINQSKIASYLYYHHINYECFKEAKRHYLGNKDLYKYFINELPGYTDFKGIIDLIDENKIEEFYPKTFKGKEDYLLRDIFKKREISTDIAFYETVEKFESASFIIKRACWETNYDQIIKILEDLEQNGKIEIIDSGKTHQQVIIKLKADGQKYIEEGEKSMPNTISGSFTNNGIMVVGSNVENSTIGNGNSSTNFDYEGLSSVINQIEKLYKNEESFTEEEKTQIASDIEEIKIAIQHKNQPVIQKCLNNIKGFVTNVEAGIIASGIWTKIQPFIQQISGMI